jgi:hypothetical protein
MDADDIVIQAKNKLSLNSSSYHLSCLGWQTACACVRPSSLTGRCGSWRGDGAGPCSIRAAQQGCLVTVYSLDGRGHWAHMLLVEHPLWLWGLGRSERMPAMGANMHPVVAQTTAPLREVLSLHVHIYSNGGVDGGALSLAYLRGRNGRDACAPSRLRLYAQPPANLSSSPCRGASPTQSFNLTRRRNA